ncbi:MAG: phosphatase PAP2-related protein [Sphingobacteriia bacterium]
MQQREKNQLLSIEWKNAWANQAFKIKAIIGSICLLFVLVSFPRFFAIIELRNGIVLNDALLSKLPSADLSIPIFITIWSTAFLLIRRIIQSPSLFLQFLLSFLFLSILRIGTISFFSLDAPIGLIPLKDPISSLFYGGKDIFITKDLFFSGHTATQFLMFLCLQKKIDKYLTGLTSILIAIMVLIQHIHYTIDVFAAFPLTYLVYLLGKKVSTY